MSIKKSQAILKCYISRIVFGLRRAQKISEDETMFCDTNRTFFSSTAGQARFSKH